MVGDLPSSHRVGQAAPPSALGSPPSYFPQLASRPRPWLAVAVAVTAAVAVAALVVALTRPAASHSSATTAAAPIHMPAETAAAQQRLCETYKLAARAVQVDTNGSDKAFARIALTNSASLLLNVSNDAALDEQHRSAAQALATAYLTDTAKSSEGAATEAEFQEAVADVNAKDAAMKKVCGGG
ncbi:hypothetical protein A5739_01360 [Mycobacterium colombiense]|uniref:hypothetical protein n=1 Tax=Mycobacterium colombiense TaxID=339268 RepID=UPI00096D1BBF|nr:hypothetical protein [Mycobacterium colombiense]OMC30690.1 hypothetical protein A5739_01360 [Mycobacterium colombiense]